MSETQTLSGSPPLPQSPNPTTSIARVAVKPGNVLKQSAAVDNEVDLAVATSLAASLAVGIAIRTAAAGALVPFAGHGAILTLTAAEWEAVTDAATPMARDNVYYVSATNAGNLTTTKPNTSTNIDMICLIGLSPTSARVWIGAMPVPIGG